MEDSLLELLCQPSHLLQEVVPVRLGALGLCCWRRRPSQRVPQPSYLSCPLQEVLLLLLVLLLCPPLILLCSPLGC